MSRTPFAVEMDDDEFSFMNISQYNVHGQVPAGVSSLAPQTAIQVLGRVRLFTIL